MSPHEWRYLKPRLGARRLVGAGRGGAGASAGGIPRGTLRGRTQAHGVDGGRCAEPVQTGGLGGLYGISGRFVPSLAIPNRLEVASAPFVSDTRGMVYHLFPVDSESRRILFLSVLAFLSLC